MSTRRHLDPRPFNPTIVPRFPRPFDGNNTAAPQALTVNPAATIGSTDRFDDIIDVDEIPHARDRVVCECGGEVTRSYLEKHRLTPKHLALVAAQRKAATKTKSNGAKQKKGDAAPKAQAHATTFGKPSAHEQNDRYEADDALYSYDEGNRASHASFDVQEYMVQHGHMHFDSINAVFMTNPYYSPDAYIHP